MPYPCDEQLTGCGKTKKAIVGWSKSTTITQRANTEFKFTSGSVDLTVYRRYRDYAYKRKEDTARNDFKYVVTPSGFGAYYAECFDQETTYDSSFNENYETEDITFYFADLRNNCFVYKKSVHKMVFKHTTDVVVPVRTSFDDAQLSPHIIEIVPIEITNTYVCTTLSTPLYIETINSGYADEIKVLMPLFNSGEPYGKFFQNSKEYDAAIVDWYYLPTHRAADGDEFFWWADWHKQVGDYKNIEAREAKTMWELMTSQIASPYTTSPDDNTLHTKTFLGSVVFDTKSNSFVSYTLYDWYGDKQQGAYLQDSNRNIVDTSALFSDIKLHYPIGLH